MNEIISKWIVKYKDHYLGITSDKDVYDVNTLTKLTEYWNNGTVSYRNGAKAHSSALLWVG